jgi:hypothetical protein
VDPILNLGGHGSCKKERERARELHTAVPSVQFLNLRISVFP